MAIYLLHYSKPLLTTAGRAARHYLGYAPDTGNAVMDRVTQHLTGRSDVKIVQAFDRIGARGRLAAIIPNATPRDEHAAKERGHFADYCPICRQERGQPAEAAYRRRKVGR